jgi:hypothetical protein
MIYKASVDGWASERFAEKVYNKGSNMILLKTTKDAVCGGFTSVSWSYKCRTNKDTEAFVFNLD